MGRAVAKMREQILARCMMAIQAAIGGNIIARENIALRKRTCQNVMAAISRVSASCSKTKGRQEVHEADWCRRGATRSIPAILQVGRLMSFITGALYVDRLFHGWKRGQMAA